MEILIAAKQNPSGIKAARQLERQLKRFAEVQLDLSTALRLRRLRHTPGTSIKNFKGDLIITLGGDGTFLWAAYQASVPIMPVRLEGQGFLCTMDFKELMKNLPRIARRDYSIFRRMRLQVTPSRKGGILSKILHKDYPLCVNEIAFARRRPSKVLETEFTIDETPFTFVGDGIMFATPAGSTAYAASAGGPLVDPALESISVIPLYPFHYPIKPMVIPATKSVEVRIKGGDCALIIDGHSGEYVKAGHAFTVERGEPLRVATFSEHRFYQKYKNSFLSMFPTGERAK